MDKIADIKKQKNARQKSAGAPIRGTHGGARPGAGHPQGVKSKGSGRHSVGATKGDPRNIKINIAINRAEASKLDAICAAKNCGRADAIRAFLNQ